MTASEAQKKASIQYAKKALKRIPLDVQKEKYVEIQAAAEKAGDSVNGYIKKAIDEKMDRDSCGVSVDTPIDTKQQLLEQLARHQEAHKNDKKEEKSPVDINDRLSQLKSEFVDK